MRLKKALAKFQIILIFVFVVLFGFSMYALWKINTRVLPIHLTWPWQVSLIGGVIGLLISSRDSK
jgi:hypothetical protein